MEGPTPVSALIHAATMVTAGVFLLIRSGYLFECCNVNLVVLGIGGGVTSIFDHKSSDRFKGADKFKIILEGD